MVYIIGVKKPTDPITFDPALPTGTSKHPAQTAGFDGFFPSIDTPEDSRFEPENDGFGNVWKMIFLPGVYSQVPCVSSGV